MFGTLPTPLFTRQPTFAADILRGHPLARNLVFAGYSYSGAFYDAITRQMSTSGSTANRVARRAVDGNLALAFEAKTTQMTFPAFSTGFDKVNGACSIFVEGSVLTNNTSQNVADSFSATSGDGFGFKFDDNNLVTNGFYLFLNNSNSSASNFDILGTNSETFRHRAMIALDGTNANFYAKNKLDIQVANTGLPLRTGTDRQTRILTGTGGAVALVLVWDRALSLAEYQSLFFNPWQVFAAPRKRFTLQRISGSPQSLTGAFFGSQERDFAGQVNFSTSLSGQSIASMERPNAGSLALGAVALAGQNIKSAEKVNAATISSLPFTAVWTQIASSNLDSVHPSTVPAPGGTSYSKVMEAWGGGAFGDGHFMIAANGGHTDYSGNEIYALRISDWTPVLLRAPCSAAIVAASDSIESSGLYATNTGGTTPDPQQPRSAHGYATQIWSTVKGKYARLGASGMYPSGQVGSTTIRYYDRTTDTWETGPDILTPFNGAYSACCEDASGNLWFIGQGTGGRLNKIVPSTGVVTEFGNAFMYSLQSYYRTGIHDPVNNRFWIFGGDGTSHETGYWDLNDQSGFIDFTPVTPTGDLSILKKAGPGVAWYAPASVFILWSGGTTVHAFDPTTFKCTPISLHASSAVTPSAAQTNGTFGRFRAISSDTFLGVNAMSENFYQLHLRGADAALTGQNILESNKNNAGTVAPGAVSLSGQNIRSQEQEFLATVANLAVALSGQNIRSAEIDFPGTLASVIGLAGQFSPNQERAFTASISALVALSGSFLPNSERDFQGLISAIYNITGGSIPSMERDFFGSLGLGTVSLAGISIKSDERSFAGAVASVIALLGLYLASSEKDNPGSIASVIALNGQSAGSLEKDNLGTVGLGAVSLSGDSIKSAERFFQAVASAAGIILSGISSPSMERYLASTVTPGAVGLAGVNIPSAERAFLAAITLAGTLNGAGILSDEKFAQAVLGLGAVALSGQKIASAEKDNAGAISSGLTVAGSFASSHEKGFQAAVTALISLVGNPIPTAERDYAGALSTLRALVGSNSGPMEQDFVGSLAKVNGVGGSFIPSAEVPRTAALAVGGVTVVGSFSSNNEKANAGTLGGLVVLLGSSAGSHEKDFSGVLTRLYSVLGSSIKTGEAIRTAILTVGGVTLVGQYIAPQEVIRVSVIIKGQIITKTLRARGAYSTTLRAAGGYATTVRVIGRYDNG